MCLVALHSFSWYSKVRDYISGLEDTQIRRQPEEKPMCV